MEAFLQGGEQEMINVLVTGGAELVTKEGGIINARPYYWGLWISLVVI